MFRKRGSEEQCVLFAEMRQDALLLFCCAQKENEFIYFLHDMTKILYSYADIESPPAQIDYFD